ncbi:hypothetical protein F5B21DRAFT_522114 [Xylaria acuta]|nr:hypothetical protein F5B21DRAFT_522114 [Xylaria acuta]
MAYNAGLSVEICNPQHFLFYVVARVGPLDSYRPLAVALRYSCEGHRLVATCRETINILSAPENRVPIDAEKHLATRFYKHDKQTVTRSYLPEPNHNPSFLVPDLMDLFDNRPGPQIEDEVFSSDLTEFPFTSSCLILGAGYDSCFYTTCEVQTRPLGIAYRNENTNYYGMVVFDITDLQNVRHGIVASKAKFDLFEGLVEDDISRELFSGSAYLHKLGYESPYKRLVENIPLAPTESLDFIWPLDIYAQPQSILNRGARVMTLVECSIFTLIDSTVDIAEFDDMSIFDQPRQLPCFQTVLLRCLGKAPGRLGSTIAAGQLLRLAYAGHRDLHWTPFKRLSFEAVASAIESPELKGAKSLSLCIDDLQGSPTSLLRALSRLDGLRRVCFFQGPSRTSDDKSKQLFLLISTDAKYSHLLESKAMTFTHTFSAPFQHWFCLTFMHPEFTLPDRTIRAIQFLDWSLQ